MDDSLDEEIRAQVDEWSSNSNEATQITLVSHNGSKAVTTFQPEFTYPIFGDEEAIFGYQDLEIDISFAAHDLRPYVEVSYAQKFKEQGEVKPTDVLGALKDFLPARALVAKSKEEVFKDEKASEFTPPGDKVAEYSVDGSKHEVWCASLSDNRARELLENMQVLVPMFIEGGSTLQLEPESTRIRWKLFLLYSVASEEVKDASRYSLVGYGTSYRVFALPDRHKPQQQDLDVFLASTQAITDFFPPVDAEVPNALAPTVMPNDIASPMDLPSRERLSQFLILPPYQGSGHGRHLYNAMYKTLTGSKNVRELTIEDPNESFDELRDLCDLLNLRRDPEFAGLRVETDIQAASLAPTAVLPTHLIVSGEAREAIRIRTKLQQRQFDRMVEMHTLSQIPTLHRSKARITRKAKSSNVLDRAYYFWRLYVKERLYIFNRDQLAQLEREERLEKLDAALDSVVEAYAKAITRAEKYESVVLAEAVEKGAARGTKRRRVVDEDGEEKGDEEGDEDGDGDGDGEATTAQLNKKTRV